MTKEALKLAIQLRDTASGYWTENEIPIIEKLIELLAQEQEPVAYATKEDFYHELERRLKHIREEMKIKSVTMRCKEYDIALPIIDTDFGRVLVGQVSTPPQRTWVALTTEQVNAITPVIEEQVLIRVAEAKLKENNT